jgi:nucleoside-triphosphatase
MARTTRSPEGAGPLRVLLEGRPGSGKTTVARRLVGLLRDRGVVVTGITTAELREAGRRVGFVVEGIGGGARAVLAHVDLVGAAGVRVGRYGVDLGALERVALPELDPAAGRIAVVDELGKMELASEAFTAAVERLLAGPVDVVATVHVARHPVTDALKARPGVHLLRVDASSRDGLPARLAAELPARQRRDSGKP